MTPRAITPLTKRGALRDSPSHDVEQHIGFTAVETCGHRHIPMLWPGYPPAFYGIFLGHEHRMPIAERDVGGPQMRVVRHWMTENFDAVRPQHVEESLRIADTGDGVHRAARKLVQGLGRTADQVQRTFRLEAHAERAVEQRTAAVHHDGVRG